MGKFQVFNPFDKDSDGFLKCLSALLDATLIAFAIFCVYATEEIIYENQKEFVVNSSDLKECIGNSDSYNYSYWVTNENDTISVPVKHQIHVHTWCCTEPWCSKTHVADGVKTIKAIHVVLEKDSIPHTTLFKWVRKKMWNW